MRLLVVGGHGFLGWHLACRAHATRGLAAERVGRATTADPATLAAAVSAADAVVHLAAVNRAATDAEVHDGTVAAARAVADAVRAAGRGVRLVHAGSIQSEADPPTAYGVAKTTAARLLGEATADVGGELVDVVLPNLYGEHGRPAYNSFVATFCDLVARGERPVVHEDRPVPLLHAQDAAEALLAACELPEGEALRTLRPPATTRTVGSVATRLAAMAATYDRGEVPALVDPDDVALFNTYRSFLAGRVHRPVVHADARGRLVEVARSHGGTGQVFVSTTAPGQRRGDHYHLRKVERFAVISGEAEIRMRRLWHGEVRTVRVRAGEPAVVDMPTMWTHAIVNTGRTELVTAFWADQLLDPEHPDQVALGVDAREGTGP